MKVVLKANDLQHLNELISQAESKSLPYYLVHDAGKTEVAHGTATVLAICGSESAVNEVTGNLSLLK